MHRNENFFLLVIEGDPRRNNCWGTQDHQQVQGRLLLEIYYLLTQLQSGHRDFQYYCTKFLRPNSLTVYFGKEWWSVRFISNLIQIQGNFLQTTLSEIYWEAVADGTVLGIIFTFFAPWRKLSSTDDLDRMAGSSLNQKIPYSTTSGRNSRPLCT